MGTGKRIFHAFVALCAVTGVATYAAMRLSGLDRLQQAAQHILETSSFQGSATSVASSTAPVEVSPQESVQTEVGTVKAVPEPVVMSQVEVAEPFVQLANAAIPPDVIEVVLDAPAPTLEPVRTAPPPEESATTISSPARTGDPLMQVQDPLKLEQPATVQTVTR